MKSTTKLFGIIAILAIALVGVAASAFAVPVSINEVKVDGTIVTPNAVTRLALERDNEMAIKVYFTATEDAKNLEVEARISGYEYDSFTPVSQSSSIFDVSANTSYSKTLTFTLPDDIQQDSYKLRITVSDRNGVTLTQDYNIKIEGARHVMKIMSVGLSENRLKAGSALLASVRVENQGQLEEKDIKAVVSVPELGITATSYIDSVKVDKQKDTEEMYLRLPTCAKAGIYDLNVEVSYSRGHETLMSSVPFEIVKNDQCTPVVLPTAVPTTTQVIVTPPAAPVEPVQPASSDNTVKTALEVILLVLIGLVVVIGIVLGLSRMGGKDEEAAA